MTEQTYHLGYLTAEKTFQLTKQVTFEQCELLHELTAPFGDISSRLNFEIATRNYKDLRGVLATMARISRMVGHGDRRVEQGKMLLLSSLSNYLNSCRMYVDTTKSAWIRRYGAESGPVRDLNATMSRAYDSRLGYRFCYKLRNLLQHVELSGLSITLSEKQNSGFQSIDLDPQALLDTFNAWGTVKQDLTDSIGTLDLTPLLADAHIGHREIERFVLTRTIEEMIPSLPSLMELVEATNCPSGAAPVLVALPGDVDKMADLDFHLALSMLPPLDSLKRIDQASRDGSVGSLVTLDPEEVEEDSVAVSVLEGPLAEQVFDLLSAAIRDDRDAINFGLLLAVSDQGSAVKTLSELLNLSNVLVHEVGMLTGQSPEVALSNHFNLT